MRLIDADKLKAESREHCKTCTLNGTKHCKTCVVNLICDRVDLQPTVEARPHGDLISREALKKALHNYFDGKVIDEPTYILRDVFVIVDNAPNCGARMEGGAE